MDEWEMFEAAIVALLGLAALAVAVHSTNGQSVAAQFIGAAANFLVAMVNKVQGI